MTQQAVPPMLVRAPGEPGFGDATAVFNLAAPVRPELAVTAHSVREVQDAVRFAIGRAMPVRMHSTGHAALAVPPVETGLLIRTRIGGGVRVDAEGRTAVVPAGCVWGDVVEVAAPLGLAPAHGSSPGVGVTGYLLRGGISSYARNVGLAANTVRAIELVDAEGDLRRVTATDDPDLFWALRGGGGGFGVVTAVEIDLFPVSAVISGAAYWPVAYAQPLLERWAEWACGASNRATTSARVLNFPPDPALPAELTRGPVVGIDGVVRAETPDCLPDARAVGHGLLGPLRDVAPPLLDTWSEGGPAAAASAHLDPADPVPFVGDHQLLHSLTPEAIARFLAELRPGSGSPLVVAGFRQFGGLLAAPPEPGGALDRIGAPFAYLGSGAAFTDGAAEALREHSGRIRHALSAWDTGGTVPSLVERFDQPQGHLGRGAAERVARIRDRVDPGGRFAGDVVQVVALSPDAVRP